MTNKLETIDDLANSMVNVELISKEEKEKRELKEELERIRKRRYNQLQQEYSEGEYTTTQMFILDTQAACLISERSGKSKLTAEEQLNIAKERIKQEFNEEDSEILLEKFPSSRTVRRWSSSEKWQKLILNKIKSNDIFSNENIFDVYTNLRDQAAHGNNAKLIELYMELAGEKGEKSSKKDSYEEKLKSLTGALSEKN